MSSKLGVENIAHTNGTNAMTISSGGVATFPNPPVNVGVSNLQYFAVDGNVSITTSDATITSYRDGHDTENFKRIGTAWTESNGVFTPTVSGMYEINFIASISATADTRYIMIMFKLSTNSEVIIHQKKTTLICHIFKVLVLIVVLILLDITIYQTLQLLD